MKRTVSFAGSVLLACSLVGCVPKSYLLVTQYPDDSPRVAEMTAAIRARVGAELVPYLLTVYNMDLIASTSDMSREVKCKRGMTYINATKPNLIFIAGDDTARYFAEKALDQPKKFVFFDIKGDPAAYKLTNLDQVTGITEQEPVAELFALMKQIVPSAHGAAVIADKSLEGDAVVAQIQQAGDLPINVVTIKRAGTFKEWMDAIKDVQARADVLVIASYSEVRRDENDYATVPVAELLEKTARANKLPDFSFWKEAVGGNGVLGAVTVPIEYQARMAARIAVLVMYYHYDFRDPDITNNLSCKERKTITSGDRALQLGVKLPDAGAPMAPPAAPAATPEPAKAAPAPDAVVPK